MRTKIEKIFIILFVLILIFFNSCVIFAVSNEPSITSKAAILLDNKTGKVLYSKNENEKMYPASTTKIVTAILTLENSNLDEVVTVSYDDVMSIPEGYSVANLQIGEELTVEQLLELLLVHSANDAANVLAKFVGGSVDSFVSMMNTKANELGLTNTHFTNVYGKHDENHYTTASDLATIMKYCIKNDDFRRLAGSASCAIPATNKYGTRKYTSTNELIVPNSKNYYSYITAGKTGFTTPAGDCLVSSAYKDNLELICVVLGGSTKNGESTRFSETRDLYEFGFSNYSIKTIVNQNDVATNIEVSNATRDTKSLDLLYSSSIEALVANDNLNDTYDFQVILSDEIKAPIEQSYLLGKVKYVIDDIEYECDLIASHSVQESKILNIVLQVGFVVLILFIIYKLIFSKNKKRKKYRKF